jgi:hypothetical protein
MSTFVGKASRVCTGTDNVLYKPLARGQMLTWEAGVPSSSFRRKPPARFGYQNVYWPTGASSRDAALEY